jgi:hypothetical protein
VREHEEHQMSQQPMNTAAATLTVVESTRYAGQLSFRGPNGSGSSDPMHEHIKAAGFKDGDRVVVIGADYFEELKALVVKQEQALQDIKDRARLEGGGWAHGRAITALNPMSPALPELALANTAHLNADPTKQSGEG